MIEEIIKFSNKSGVEVNLPISEYKDKSTINFMGMELRQEY